MLAEDDRVDVQPVTFIHREPNQSIRGRVDEVGTINTNLSDLLLFHG